MLTIKNLSLACACSLLMLSILPSVAAEQNQQATTAHENRDARRAEFESLSDEEKTARRSERKARFESLSDEEKSARKANRKTRFDALSDEQQQHIRQRRSQRGKNANNAGE